MLSEIIIINKTLKNILIVSIVPADVLAQLGAKTYLVVRIRCVYGTGIGRLNSDAIWRHRFWSTLAKIMACCLTAIIHCVNQCWLIICEVLWYLRAISQEKLKISILHMNLKIADLRLQLYQRGQWVTRPFIWCTASIDPKLQGAVCWMSFWFFS